MENVANISWDEPCSVPDWETGVWAGLIAGLVFVILEIALTWMVQGQSPWGPPHMMADMVLGAEVLPPMGVRAPFDVKIMMTAMTIHLPMSIALGLIGAWLMHRFELVAAVMIGVTLGLAIYVVNFYLIAPLAFPWFEMGRNWIDAFSHLMFGAVMGLAYVTFRKPTTVTLSKPTTFAADLTSPRK